MEEKLHEQLKEPECYLNTENGDLYIIWWIRNRPIGNEWIRISKLAYDNLTKSIFGRIEDLT